MLQATCAASQVTRRKSSAWTVVLGGPGCWHRCPKTEKYASGTSQARPASHRPPPPPPCLWSAPDSEPVYKFSGRRESMCCQSSPGSLNPPSPPSSGTVLRYVECGVSCILTPLCCFFAMHFPGMVGCLPPGGGGEVRRGGMLAVADKGWM